MTDKEHSMKFTFRPITAILICFFLFPGHFAQARVKLPQLFGDGMVLQRNAAIKIWGWANPGEAVRVNFNHKSYKTTAGANTKWMLVLPEMKAGGPYTMKISGLNHLIIHDIMIGDVWFCSGQSNMVISMERVKERYPEEIANANYPQIRNFFVPTASDVRDTHDDLPPGNWEKADPKNVLSFGAATWFFAKQIYLKYHIPIGIINSSVGGTPIEAWISGTGLQSLSQYTKRLAQFKDTAFVNSSIRLQRAKEKIAQEKEKIVQRADLGLNGAKTWYDTTYVPQHWHSFWLPGYWADQGIKDLNGIVWFRKEVDLPPSVKGQPAKLFMGRIVDADMVYVNGMLAGSTTYQYPPRRYELPPGLLKSGKNIIVVKLINYTGKGGFVPDKPYYIAAGGQKIDLCGYWQYQVGEVFSPLKSNPDSGVLVMQNEPTGLFNTMVAPVINFAVKGVLWYQGEANTFKPAEYQYLLPALVTDWRSIWQQPNMPFIYVQLPNFMEVQYSPAESKWAELREQQLKGLAIPNTGMAVTIDAGEWNDIHPLNKKDVGERMSLIAERIAYGDKAVVSSGPIYQSAAVKGSQIIISFTDTGSGLIAKGGTELTQFAIAGEDKKYVWANATIKGTQVIVWSDKITKPVYVRYAWADNPEGANLYNKEGLPASPFTTDNL